MYCNAAASMSSSVTFSVNGSRSVTMLRHMGHLPLWIPWTLS
jgi:hypothetical protein